MTTTIVDLCECCHLPVGSVSHFADEEYPPGKVWCRVCWRDWYVGQALGVTLACARSGPAESTDLATGQVTTLTEDGVSTTTRREPVFWAGPGPAPDWLRPALGPEANDQEGHDR